MERFRERRRRGTRLPAATWAREYVVGMFGVVIVAGGGFDLIFHAPSAWLSILGWLLVMTAVAIVLLSVRWLACRWTRRRSIDGTAGVT